jgi:type IV secretory pathway VirB2 component (pilin)
MMTRVFTIATLYALPLFALAEGYTGVKLKDPVARIMEPQNLIDLLVTIFQFLGGPIVVIGIIYAGYLLVTAQGDEHKLEEGKKTLLWVIIGAAVILGATVLKEVVQGTINELR